MFRRILSDPDFRAGKLDTGFLDRLLANPDARAWKMSDREGKAKIAAIAAGLFAVLEPAALSSNGATVACKPEASPSKWKQAGRAESMRSLE